MFLGYHIHKYTNASIIGNRLSGRPTTIRLDLQRDGSKIQPKNIIPR